MCVFVEAQPSGVCGQFCDGRYELFYCHAVTYKTWLAINCTVALTALLVFPFVLSEIHHQISQCKYYLFAWLLVLIPKLTEVMSGW